MLPLAQIPFLPSLTVSDSTQQAIPIKEALSPDKIKGIDFAAFGYEWLQKLIDFGIRVVLAVIIFYIGRWIAQGVLKLLKKGLAKRSIDPAVASFLYSALRILLFCIVIVAAVNMLGVTPVSFAALIAAAGVTIGASLSGQLQNLASGVIILITRPFAVGHYIKAGTVEGTVHRVAIFFTTLYTIDNKVIYIPNAKITSDALINYTEMVTRRCDWVVGVDYNTDFDRVKEVLTRIAQNETRMLDTPAFQIELTELGSNSVNIFLRAWCKTEDYWQLTWDVNQKIYKQFNQEKISFAFPQLRIHTVKGE